MSRTEEYLAREKKSIYTTTTGTPIIQSGGLWGIQDVDGRMFSDGSSQCCLTNTGPSHPRIVSAIKQAAEKFHAGISADFPYCFNIKVEGKEYEVSRAALAEKLIELTDSIMPFPKRVAFDVTGALAVNLALKIAKISYFRELGFTTKDLTPYFNGKIFDPSLDSLFRCSFLGFENAFHGRHGEAQLLTNTKPQQLWAASSSCAFGRLTFPRLGTAARDIIKEADLMVKELLKIAPVVAFVFEPIQGEGGVILPSKDCLRSLIVYLRSIGVYIIADEIQTGLGRTGKWFACEHYGIQPDMVLLSKSLGAGIPISAVVANADKFPDLEPGMHSGSLHATPLAVAAAMVNFDIIEESLPKMPLLEKFVKGFLKDGLCSQYEEIKKVRQKGLMIGIEFATQEIRDAVIEECESQGLVLLKASRNTARFYPQINVSKSNIEKGLHVFKSVLEKLFRK